MLLQKMVRTAALAVIRLRTHKADPQHERYIMGFVEWAKAFFERVAPEALSHLESPEADFYKVEQERLNLEHERDVYKRELLRLGYRPELLKAMASAHLVEVRAS